MWHLVHHVLSSLVVLLSVVVVVVSHVSLTTSLHVHLLSSGMVHLLVHGLVLLNEGQDLLDDLGQVRVGVQVVPLESTGLLGLVVLEISLILGSFELDLSELLDLVMVDNENLIAIGLVRQGVLGVGSGIWLFVANESISITGLTFVKSDLLDLTTLLEEILKVILSPVGWEVLNVKVASLLGVLVLDGFLDLLNSSVGLLHGGSNVKLDFFIVSTLTHDLTLELFDSFLGALWTVLL